MNKKEGVKRTFWTHWSIYPLDNLPIGQFTGALCRTRAPYTIYIRCLFIPVSLLFLYSYLSVYLSVCLSVGLSVSVSACLSFCL